MYSDILARHISIHNNAARQSEPESSGNNSSKRLRACMECARAREKCTKTTPCFRCSARSLECIYPEKRPEPNVNDAAIDVADDQVSYSVNTSDPLFGHHNVTAPLGATPGVNHFPEGLGDATSPLSSNPIVGGSSTTQPRVAPNTRFQAQESAASYYDMTGLGFGEDRQARAPSQFYSNEAPAPAPDTFMYAPSVYDTALDFPMNWLPANDAIDVDYSSILGLVLSPGNLQPAPGALSYNDPVPVQASDQAHGGTPRSHLVTSPSETVSTTSQASINSVPPSATKGGLYATSTNGARAPCTVRSKRADPSVHIHNSQSLSPISDAPEVASWDDGILSFPDLTHVLLDEPARLEQNRTIQASLHEIIQESFHRLCLGSNPLHKPFGSVNFPSIEQLNFFVGLYFDQFASSLPILHELSFDVNDYWPLTLAVAAIGCQYTQTQEFWSYVAPMHEFLRRVMLVEQDNRARAGDGDTPYIQAMILSQIGLLYCGPLNMRALAQRRHGELVGLIKFDRLLVPSDDHRSSDHGTSQRWANWMTAETKRRLGYSILVREVVLQPHRTF